jgi:hypothetical protein
MTTPLERRLAAWAARVGAVADDCVDIPVTELDHIAGVLGDTFDKREVNRLCKTLLRQPSLWGSGANTIRLEFVGALLFRISMCTTPNILSFYSVLPI